LGEELCSFRQYMKKSSALLTFSLCLLVGAIGLVTYGSMRVPEPTFHGAVHALLPPPPPGWSIKEKPIATSPEMQEAVGELLNFDDGVFVDYLGPSKERVSVYIAYWSPGRMSHRLVATHTPDVCWVGGGWEKRASGDTSGAAPKLPTGEARLFVARGNPEHVWFWHLVGTESKRYGTGHVPPWHAALTEVFRKGLNQREEQFFIRI
jgi:hypothetical protein